MRIQMPLKTMLLFICVGLAILPVLLTGGITLWELHDFSEDAIDTAFSGLEKQAFEALGAGVRGSKTNRGQGYHTDNSYNLPPEYVGLTCLKTAMEGGQSGLVSFYTAHNAMLQRHPDLLSRLYEDFYFERYDEFAAGTTREARFVRACDRLHLGVRLVGYVRAGARGLGEFVPGLEALDLAEFPPCEELRREILTALEGIG